MSYDPILDPALEAAADAATRAYARARRSHSRGELAEMSGMGADGTPTKWLDQIIEDALERALAHHPVNVLSEESGWDDRGHAATLVIDPLDGTANAVADVPLCCFAAALVVDGVFVESLTVWLETGQRWAATTAEPAPWRTTGRTELDGAAISLLRPHPRNTENWFRVAERAERIRILSSSTFEAAMVLQGSTDGFADAGSDSQRLVDLAPALVSIPPAGGAVLDCAGRPIEFDPDLGNRFSGVVGATPAIAEQLVETIAMAPLVQA
jgi:myo-inositol-1(or 4)-monophosphatase